MTPDRWDLLYRAGTKGQKMFWSLCQSVQLTKYFREILVADTKQSEQFAFYIFRKRIPEDTTVSKWGIAATREEM